MPNCVIGGCTHLHTCIQLHVPSVRHIHFMVISTETFQPKVSWSAGKAIYWLPINSLSSVWILASVTISSTPVMFVWSSNYFISTMWHNFYFFLINLSCHICERSIYDFKWRSSILSCYTLNLFMLVFWLFSQWVPALYLHQGLNFLVWFSYIISWIFKYFLTLVAFVVIHFQIFWDNVSS